MTSLTDLARSSAAVHGVPVFGISAKGIAHCFNRFPVLRQLFGGQTVDFSPEMISTLAPEAVAVIIACGTGSTGDKDAEDSAALLPLQVQAEMLDKIIALTMPMGVGPFVEMIGRLGAMLGISPDALPGGSKEADTNSPKP